MSILTVSGVSAAIHEKFGLRVSPRLITAWFYTNVLRSDICPIHCGRRAIPASYLPEIVRVLQRRGKLPQGSQRQAS